MPSPPIGPDPGGGTDSPADPLRRLNLDAGTSPEALTDLARHGLQDLASPRGEAALAIIEAIGDPALEEELAEALIEQPEPLPVDRLWRALEVLEGTGQIEARPALLALREELIEAIDGDDASIEGLIEQIEEDPEDVWVALQGLAEIEPEVRAEIVAELGTGGPIGPGTTELLRLLCYAHEPALRRSALEALDASGPTAPDLPESDEGPLADPRIAAWADLVAHHPAPEVTARARRHLGGRWSVAQDLPAVRSRPRIVSSLVTGLDGKGRGHVALVAEDDERGVQVAAAYVCDVLGGIREVVGRIAPLGDFEAADALLGELRARPDRDSVENEHGLALGLLAGSLLLCGAETTPALRYWLERSVGPDLRPRPFAGLATAGSEPIVPPPFEEMPVRVAEVFDACPGWVDDSDLTFELAEELQLRWPSSPPDPGRDAGAYRFLFEHRLLGQLELYRRMLFWMGWLWRSAGAEELSRSALTIAEQLSDPQHVVPAHPFMAALSTRSLLAAQEGLRNGLDLRDQATRARLDAGDWPV